MFTIKLLRNESNCCIIYKNIHHFIDIQTFIFWISHIFTYLHTRKENIMKTKVLALLFTSVSVLTLLTACGNLKECDFCGKLKPCKTEAVLGQEIAICDDCQKEINDFANGIMNLN